MCVWAELDRKRRREEEAREAGVVSEDNEFPNRRRNMILAAIFAGAAMLGYAYFTGLVQLSILDSLESRFSGKSEEENANSNNVNTNASGVTASAAEEFDPLEEQDFYEGED
jgi:hypothetical protein